MGIHETDTPPKQAMSFDHAPYFVQLGDFDVGSPGTELEFAL